AAELGFETLFHGVAMQPGKPLLAAARGATLLFGLPGNPGSVMTSFWLFVRPALRRLAGEAAEFWAPRLAGRLAGRLGGGRSRDRFVPARAELREGGWSVRSLAPKGSHDLTAFAGANALLRVPRAAAPREAGADCEFLPLDPLS
ncbi:MAG: molybdopterin-binding protein, partial [Thermoanaerobaculia bacterium]